MSSDADFDRAVDRVRNFVTRIGDTVAEPIQDREDGTRTVGFVVERDSYRYQVLGQPGQEFFHVIFPFSIVSQLEGVMTREAAIEILADDEDDLDDVAERAPEDPRHNAALRVLNGVAPGEREAFAYYLVIILGSGDAAFVLQNTDTGMVAGFQVFTKVFPYEREFSLTEFNRSVQSVVNTGISAMLFVNFTFDLPSMVDNGGVTGMPPWYIH
ncbi:MAG: hypothetical protein ABEJ31_09105 [Haloarculaceae archaeon]